MCTLCFSSLDPEHQRANGNLVYFEYIMSKEKDANKSASGDQSDQKTAPKKKGIAVDYLPERQKYEMLCRGEGIKMVKWKKSIVCMCVRLCGDVSVFVSSPGGIQSFVYCSLCGKIRMTAQNSMLCAYRSENASLCMRYTLFPK
jgi:hypothetical protein